LRGCTASVKPEDMCWRDGFSQECGYNFSIDINKSLITVPNVAVRIAVKLLKVIFEHYTDLFEGLKFFPCEHQIKLKPDVVPVIHPSQKVLVASQEQD
jgi:hypothetical protein